MTIINQYVEAKVSPYTERTYKATELAETYGVTDAAVRNGWYKWLLKVAPAELLKDGKQFTQFAKTLFDEFSQLEQSERNDWVIDAKKRYAQEWGSVGVIECDVVPQEVGGTLALLSANNSLLNQEIALQLAEAHEYVDTMNAVDADISEAEIKQAIARGTKKGITLFKVEQAAEEQVKNELRQRRAGGGQQS